MRKKNIFLRKAGQSASFVISLKIFDAVLYRFSFNVKYDFDPFLKVPVEIEKKSVHHSIKNFRRFHLFGTLAHFPRKNIFIPHDDDFKKVTTRPQEGFHAPGHTT